MANVLAELFQNTANAIREKTGDTGTMKPADFPDKIRSIETGGGEAKLVPLTVTKNGTYYPTENIEVGKTYSLRNDYTQEELKALYDLAPFKSEDGVYAFLLGTTEMGMLGVTYQYGAYGVYISTGYVWMPSAVASQLGAVEGWYFGTDISNLAPTDIPTIPITEGSFSLEVESFSDLNPLFALAEMDGFSSATINVPIPDGYIKPSGVRSITTNGTVDVRQYESVEVNVPTGSSEGELVINSGDYSVSAIGDVVTIAHGLGVVPDVVIVRMAGTIPGSTPVLTFFSATVFSKNLIPSGNNQFAMLFTTEDGYISPSTATVDMTGTSGFVQNANTLTFQVGGPYARHIVGNTYTWTAIGNLK